MNATAPQKTIRWPAVVLLIITFAWTATMMASLRWRFLDPFVVGATHGKIGYDFFQNPRGFANLLAGNNIYVTEISDYGPYATPFFCHPMVAMVVGGWTMWLAPWTSYAIFVDMSVVMLALCAWLLGSVFDDPTHKAFAYFALFCTMPTYLMLWNAQAHVFVVLAVSLILAGLMRLEQEPESGDRFLRWIQAGALISLFSKPTVLLMLPVLLILPETRRKIVLPVAIYAAVSLCFLLVPRLNVGGLNVTHWLTLLQASAASVQSHWLVIPCPIDHRTNIELYSLPRLMAHYFGNRPLCGVVAKAPLLMIGLLSFAPAFLADRSRRIQMAVVVVALCVLSHYLCYFVAYEYHYTAMLPLLPVLLWLRRKEPSRGLRLQLAAAFAASLVVFLPTVNILYAQDIVAGWIWCGLERVLPIVAMFALLAIYGFVKAWPRDRTSFVEVGRAAFAQLQNVGRPALIIGLLLAAVFTAALCMSPDRWLAWPSTWDRVTWENHLEEMLSRPGVNQKTQFEMHRFLTLLYLTNDAERAKLHCQEACRIKPEWRNSKELTGALKMTQKKTQKTN
jgi:hypothetical protein